MGQDWRTLGLVVVVAAIAGWLLVRLIGGGTERHDAVPVAAAPVASRDVETGATSAPQHAAAPTGPARTTAPAPAAEDGGDVAYISRDLEVLSGALVRDQRIEDRVMPRINDGLDVPGVMSYRRAPDFWEPALGGSRGAKR
jgi:hypothetical protein